MSFARSGSTHVVVEVFLLPFKLCHVLDRTNWHQIKLLEVVVFNDITIGNRISLELMSRISSCLGSDFIELLDLLFEREVCSLKVLNKLVLRLHDKDLLVKFLLKLELQLLLNLGLFHYFGVFHCLEVFTL